MSRKIATDSAPLTVGSRYPAPYDEPCRARARRRLGDAAGLTQFGVNLLRLPPGCWSSQRHWHAAEDEFVFVVEGELVLVTEEGEETLRAGECAGFKAGVPDGHQLQNRSGRDALILEVGSRRPEDEEVIYPGIDLKLPRGTRAFTHADGKPYTDAKPDAKPRGSTSGK
jgi:uncharacterized cupin superfamily protein